LYQFIPNHKYLVDKLLNSANKKVIISEPIINLTSSKNIFISTIAKYSANPSTGNKIFRFTKKTLTNFIFHHYSDRLENISIIAGGRNMIITLNAN